ncbi:macro domain-containing protein [Egibacter rhizosphaerae]|uniref:Macro domain-containing protein n=1 Tax=Egibacter rhizosphaerae TaxID=1670831 RepID=A0A411YH58_9ACTN|nr:macro domain-containing protein [Egibacter rhizosphaerae]QBI20594.1 macro domain-containing protein [Egibacter rhizosphaerae]
MSKDPAARDGNVIGRQEIGSRRVVALQGDLTAQHVDAIVNAANEQLQHGGGVAAAIAKAGGHDIQRESDAWLHEHGEVGHGEAAVTSAGRMPADYVVHVVGPRYKDGQDNARLLRETVAAALDAARDYDCKSIALPAISAGIFGYPADEATRVIGEACLAWLGDDAGSLTEVRLVGIDQRGAELFAAGIGGASTLRGGSDPRN